MNSYKNYNILLVNIDGFRRDKVELCPTLNSFKKISYYFSNMNTVSPYTFASLHAIFSGMYPSRNGVNGYYNIFKFKKDEIQTIPQLLKSTGYYTSCDIIDESVIPKQGFNEINVFDEKTVNFQERHSNLIKNLIGKEKFFLFLHYTEAHKHLVEAVIQKYKQESINDEYFNKQKENDERFNSHIPACDNYVATIINTLKDLRIFEKTIIIFFSDHGTSIGEKKGEKFYGVYAYDYTVNVFCMIYIPQKSPKEIKQQCRTIDILPTILDIAQISPDKNYAKKIQGESLFQLIENPGAKDREVFIETGGLYGPWPSPKKHNVFSIKHNSKKLIYNDSPQTWEFYDLQKDPLELNNIYDNSADEIKILKKRLLHYFKENQIDTYLQDID